MVEPIEPSSEDCCGSGCNPCIFDVYQKQLKLYKQYQETGVKFECIDTGISPMEYTSFTVIETSTICDTLKTIKFRKSVADKNKKVLWNAGAHFLLKFQSGQFSCTRAYTPFKLKSNCDIDFDFAIVVKKYSNGNVSSYLFNLIVGQETLWRGPYGSYNVMSNLYTNIIMIAQGTGIAPFITIIDEILDCEEDSTKIILFYCCSNLETILFREELYIFKSYWNFDYTVYLSNCLDDSKFKYEEPIKQGRLTFDDICNKKPLINSQFLLCGSTQFMSEFETCLLEVYIPKENIVLF